MMWRERIQAARERGAFTNNVTDYGSCAVGEQVKRGLIPSWRFFYGGDSLLGHAPSALGIRFWRAVDSNDFDTAEDLLSHIEDRALQLKREATA